MWKKNEKNDILQYEAVCDHLGNEICTNTGENIELYTVWGKKCSNGNK
ncbi:hypothetical protein KGV52_01590 [Candidatus Gracilibacteria bacterium]|nr:hypothetical protein [Candidatus Gracilibacteria bacterium]